MADLPDKLLLRRGEVMSHLGLTEQVMSDLVAAGALKPIYLRGTTRAFYLRADVVKLVETQPKGKQGS